MPQEIERKYLVVDDSWKTLPVHQIIEISQSYLRRVITVRIDFIDENTVSIALGEGDQTIARTITQPPDKVRKFRGIEDLPTYNKADKTLAQEKSLVLRFRTAAVGDEKEAYFTIKRATGSLEVNDEFEIPVPHDMALEVIDKFCHGTVAKTRHIIFHDGRKWEVDVFHGPLTGLCWAEIEVADPAEFDRLEKPPGVGENITDVPGANNKYLGRKGIPPQLRQRLGL